MRHLPALALALFTSILVSAAQGPAGWKDASPHTVKFVAVDNGVELEVLDWGGAGPEIVLLWRDLAARPTSTTTSLQC